MLEDFLKFLYRHRAVTLLIALLLLGVSAGFLPGLTFNDSPERWLPASIRDAWKRFSEHYEYGDTIAIGLQFHRQVVDDDLVFLKDLRQDLMGIPGVMRVIDVSLLAEEIECVPLTEMLAEPEEGQTDRFEAYRGVLFDDPRAWMPEAAEDGPPGRTLLTILDLNLRTNHEGREPVDGETGTYQERLDSLRRAAVRELYRVLERHHRDDVTFHVIGGIVIQYELEKIARSMMATLVPLSLAFILVALLVGFRSATAVAIALAGGAWSMIVLLGVVALSGGSLNVVTVGGPPLMAVIVIATTVHFSHHYSRRRADGSTASSFDFIRWVAVPCLGAAVAAGFGFLMLAFNELGPARELGLELFFGSVLAFLGAFLLWLVLHPYRAAEGRILSPRNLGRCQRVVVAWPRLTVTALLVLTLSLIWGSTRVKIDADPFSFFQPGSPFATAIQHLSERRFGHYILDVVLIPKQRPEDPDARAEARQRDVDAARRFEWRIRGRPEVRNVVSALDLRARFQSLQTVLADLRRVLAFREMFKNWTVDQKGEDSIRITFTVADSGQGFAALMEEVEEALPRERFDVILSGTAASVAALAEGLVGGIVRGLGVALVVMALLCGLLFRSIRLTVLAFLPNAFPILFIFGLMGICEIPLNSGSAMVATIALGMGLNDTVHFVMHYRRRRLQGEDPDVAVAGTFMEIGRPLVVTSTVNCFGFAIFLLSDFRPMFHFGLLASIAMAAALVGDLVLLPNLLKLFDHQAGRGEGSDTSDLESASFPLPSAR